MSLLISIGLIAVVAVEVISLSQQVEAKGWSIESPAANASRSRCIHF